MKKLALTLLLPFGALLAACVDNDGPLEQVGEEIDEAAEDIRNQGETPANQIDDAIDDIRDSAEDAADEVEDAL